MFKWKGCMILLLMKEMIIETEKISSGKNGGMTHYISICGVFEFELSHVNEVEMEERSQSVLEVMDLDGGLIVIEDTMDDYWEEEYHFIEKLNHYVWKWAKQIR